MKSKQPELSWSEVQLTCCHSINQPRETTDGGKKDGQGRNITWILANWAVTDVKNMCSNNDNIIQNMLSFKKATS